MSTPIKWIDSLPYHIRSLDERLNNPEYYLCIIQPVLVLHFLVEKVAKLIVRDSIKIGELILDVTAELQLID